MVLSAATVSERRSVWVTGAGVISAAGDGIEALGAALREDRVCSVPSGSPLPVRAVAQVSVPIATLPDFPDDRKAALAMHALAGALADAGNPELAGPRTGVFLGTGLSSITPRELAEDVYPHLRDGRFDRVSMAADLRSDRVAPRRHLPERVTEAVAARIGATGPTGTSFSACAAAAQAMAAGMRAIRRGEIDRAIVGGHDSMIHPMGLLSFVVLGALSEEACRPFDQNRSGFMIGEGAALFVLEAADVAAQRGARARAVLLGAGTSVDAWNVTAPHPDGAGAEQAMRRALADANLQPSDIGYINAHGTGTPVGDVAEARAIWRVFGESVPVSSIKGAIGHTIAAAGAVEAAAAIVAMSGGWLPGTVGLRRQDPECPIRALRAPCVQSVSAVLSNSFGFGGQNCSIILGSVER
jgi:3-oxoacyl-[acyl-carrier-protein] synthase II